MFNAVPLLFLILPIVCGQQVGTQVAENHPQLSIQQCTQKDGCVTQAGSVVLDSNWRWLHQTTSTTNCYTGDTWNTALCPDGVTCAQNCALEGADYSGTYGITTANDSLTLTFVTWSAQKNVGSRVYFMANDTNYQTFHLKNQEFAFDVDVSNLSCGINGALYFVEMDSDGGLSKYPNNKAGAKYGGGYCDAQCPQDIKFINGEANVGGWNSSSSDPNSGKGTYGTCCNEMDVWEANSQGAAYTPHSCSVQGQTRCSGASCGAGTEGWCDKDGCDFNSYRLGNTSFFGTGMTVDTRYKFTVVTQFLTTDKTTTGTLSEIRRLYVQNGLIIQNTKVNIPSLKAYDSITDQFCRDETTVFDDSSSFESRGGLKTIGKAFDHGMVLVMSLWDDHADNMLWLDSDFPVGQDISPGLARGPCPTSSGVPTDVESQSPNASVTFSNIKFGDLGSTYA